MSATSTSDLGDDARRLLLGEPSANTPNPLARTFAASSKRAEEPKKVLVIGKGTSGKAAASLAESQGSQVEFADGVGLVIASPGVRVMSELEFGCRELKKLGVKMLAVTGSKGKSSVVKLVADALNLAGLHATPCGNYGLPVSELANQLSASNFQHSTPAWAVVEVSSFMMETTNLPPGTFEAAAILNLQEDHLDRHGSAEAYHALKLRLMDFAKVGFAPGDARCDTAAVPKGCYFDNDVLRVNGAYAVALMRAAGLDDAVIARAFSEFKPLPHRFQTVAELDGVRYVDDSKATSIAALVAGVAMSGGKTRLIAGGLPKGDDPKSALPILTKQVKKVYLIGRCAEEFRSVWSCAVDCEVCETMDKAVEAARREAEKGDTVLLSPGTASFDQFKSFGERGEVFARLVKKEG